MAADRAGEPRRGVWLYPGVSAGALVDAVITAEQVGLDEVWIADEGVAREPVPVLAAAARETMSISLCIGITSPLLRHPGAVAASVATLDELSGGRAVLGFGVGGHQSLEPFGIGTDRPVGLVADAIGMARAVFTGASVPGYEPPEHAMAPRDVPIWVGARGPQLTRLAAGRADGLFLSGCSPDELERIVPEVRGVNASVRLALYHSASDTDGRASASPWDDVGVHLSALGDRWRPSSIGINLVELTDPGADAPALVRRAADVLLG